jgi:hypothetical protein
MDYGHSAKFGPDDPDPDIYLMEAVQWLLELLGDRAAGNEVERAEALLDAWLRSGKLVAWAVKRDCPDPAEVDPSAWRNHWLDWRTGRAVKVTRGGTGRLQVFWRTDGEYRDVHFDRGAFLTLAAAELGPALSLDRDSEPTSEMNQTGDCLGPIPTIQTEGQPEPATQTRAAPEEMARPAIRKYPGFDVRDEPLVQRALTIAAAEGCSPWNAVHQIPAQEIAGSGTAESRYKRIYEKVCKRLQSSEIACN